MRLINIPGLKQNNPFRKPHPFDYKSHYITVDTVLFVIWLLRIFSPAVWWGALFSTRGEDRRYFSAPRAMEVYLILVFIFGLTAPIWSIIEQQSPYLTTLITKTVLLILYTVFIIEIVQYHFFLMIIRPAIDKKYKQYAAVRTIILTFMAYINVVNFFSIIYFTEFSQQFSMSMSSWNTWGFSVGQMTGTGYAAAGIGSSGTLHVVAGGQKLIGIFFLTIIIAQSLQSLARDEFGRNPNVAAEGKRNGKKNI